MPGFGLPSIHGLTSAAIGTVNQFVIATIQRSTGSTQNPDFTRTPTYTTASISCQVQALNFKDLTQLDGLNIQGVRRKVYVAGAIEGVIRVGQKGGDLIVFPPGTPGVPEGLTWLAVLVLEQWSQWCCVAIQLQDV